MLAKASADRLPSLKILPRLYFAASIKEGPNLIKQVRERMQTFYISLDQVKHSSGVNLHNHLTHPNIPRHLKANDNSRELSLKRTTHPQGIYIAREANDMHFRNPSPAAYHQKINSSHDEDFPKFNGNNLESWRDSIEPYSGLLYKTIVKVKRDSKPAQVGDTVRFKYILYDGTKEPKKKGGQLKLGNCEFGQGFDDGILGMKCEETRRLAIRHDLEPPDKKESWTMYDVMLFAIHTQ